MEESYEQYLAQAPEDELREGEPYQSFRHIIHHYPAEYQEDSREDDEKRRIYEFILFFEREPCRCGVG